MVKRVIHTTADFDYADHLVFSEGAVQRGGLRAIGGLHDRHRYPDGSSGINKRVLELGLAARCSALCPTSTCQ